MPVPIADNNQLAIVEAGQCGAVPDRNQGRGGEAGLEQPVQHRLGVVVERCRRLIEQEEIRLLQERARDAEPLLLALGQRALPVRFLIQALDQLR